MLNIIAVTMGDAAGISPEIILKAFLNHEMKDVPAVVIGCHQTLLKAQQYHELLSLDFKVIEDPQDAKFKAGRINIIDIPLENPDELKFGEVQAQCGNAAYQCIKKIVQLSVEGKITSLATAPLNKESLHAAGHIYPGHTELLAELTNTEDYSMLLYSPNLKVIHVSTHISLRTFLDTLNKKRVERVINIANDFLQMAGYEKPNIAVAGVNPHAGENGLFGIEEIEILDPVIKKCQAEGIKVDGPIAPDTVFLRAFNGEFDLVVAMYHDQGHIPLKLIGFYDGINISAGLPFIRTSVDHGTAFDIAWKGVAKEESLVKAILLASELSTKQMELT